MVLAAAGGEAVIAYSLAAATLLVSATILVSLQRLIKQVGKLTASVDKVEAIFYGEKYGLEAWFDDLKDES